MSTSAERKGFVTQIVQEEEEWVRIFSRATKSSGISSEDVNRLRAFWATIGGAYGRDEGVQIFVNQPGLERDGFPEGSIECKLQHERIEAQLRRGGTSSHEAHLKAIEAEFREARRLGILRDYAVAEIRSCLKGCFLEDVLDKTLAYFRVKRER